MEATMYFKRGRDQNYMMRSEKRPGYPGRAPKPPKKPIWYQILTILLLVICCPVGLILLWRKRLAWPGGAKLVATLLSLILLFLIVGALLWYPFKDERLQAVQHSVSTAIEKATDHFADADENWRAIWENGREIGAAAGNHALGYLLEAIASPTPEPTQVPPMTLSEGEDSRETLASLFNQPTPSPEPTPSPTPTPTLEPTDTPEPTATSAPSASANVLDRPTPSGNAPTGSLQPTVEGATHTPVPPVTPTPTPTATPEPTPTPTATPEPTIDPALIPRLTKGSELTVYFNDNSGWYHRSETCKNMPGSDAHTLAEAQERNLKYHNYCQPYAYDWIEVDYVVFASTDGYWHVNSGCESMTEEYELMALDAARTDATLSPCDACGALYYVDGIPAALLDGDETAAVGNDEGVTTTVISSAPTPNTNSVDLDKVTNGDALVYYNDNTSVYHARSTCSSAATVTFVPHKLMDALLINKEPCKVCEPAVAEFAD